MATPPVLCKPQVGVPLRLYFAVTEWAVSSVLVQEQNQVQKPIYFVSKALHGPEIEVPVTREGGASGSIFSTKAPPLFPQLHSGGDDKPVRKDGFKLEGG